MPTKTAKETEPTLVPLREVVAAARAQGKELFIDDRARRTMEEFRLLSGSPEQVHVDGLRAMRDGRSHLPTIPATLASVLTVCEGMELAP